MQGNIDFTGSLSGSIAGGGGGGGSEVTITPTLESGTKIADYTIDDTTGSLYAPTPPVVPEHIVTDIYGFNYAPYPSTEVARYKIDNGEEQSIRTPDYKTTWEAYPGVAQDYKIGEISCYGSDYDVKIPNFQRPLTEGTGISIDPSTDTISCTVSGNVDYLTTEQDTGIKWIDGRSIYIRTITIPNVSFTIQQSGFYRLNADVHSYIPTTDIAWIVPDASYIEEYYAPTYYYRSFDFWEWEGDSTKATQNFALFKRAVDTDTNRNVILTIKYVK